MQARFKTKPDALRFRDGLIETGMPSQLYKGHREYVVQFTIPPEVIFPPEDYELSLLPKEKPGESP